jgi:hypothetical protein
MTNSDTDRNTNQGRLQGTRTWTLITQTECLKRVVLSKNQPDASPRKCGLMLDPPTFSVEPGLEHKDTP